MFAILMACSIVLMVLPARWTSGLKCVRQVLVPFQDGMYAIASGSGSGTDRPAKISTDEYQRLLTNLESKRNEIISLRLMIREMEAQRPTIALILNKLVDRTASREGRLVPARVIAGDTAAWRDTMLLNVGRRRGLVRDAWVASRRVLDAGGRDGVGRGMIVLAREYLIGRIDEITPYSSRLVLLSDEESKVQVWIGRVERERFRVLGSPEALRRGQAWAEPGQEANFLLVGRDQGEMVINGVHEAYVDRNALTVGELVVSAGASAELPIALVIGRVEKIEDDPAQRQLRRLIVRCPLDTSRLRWVYVIDAPPRERKSTR